MSFAPERVLGRDTAGWVLSVHDNPLRAEWRYRLTRETTGESWSCTVSMAEVHDRMALPKLQAWALLVTGAALPAEGITRRIELE